MLRLRASPEFFPSSSRTGGSQPIPAPEGRQFLSEETPNGLQGLGNYLCIGNNRHEVSVPAPAGDYVPVKVVRKTRSGYRAYINPRINAFRAECALQ
jgi:hypothetical protein